MCTDEKRQRKNKRIDRGDGKERKTEVVGGGGGQRWKRETVYLYTLSSVLVRMTFGFRTSTDGIKIFF